MSENLRYVPCPGCRGLAFEVLHDEKAMLAHVLCSGCKRELLSVALAPPNEPVKVGP